MRFPQLPFAASAGALAAIGAIVLLTACAWSDSSTASGARMLNDSLPSYQVKVAPGQDTALSTCQIRIRSNPDGKVTLMGWVDTPGTARCAGEDAKHSADPAKLDSQLRVLSRMQALEGGPYTPAGLPPEAPASAPAVR